MCFISHSRGPTRKFTSLILEQLHSIRPSEIAVQCKHLVLAVLMRGVRVRAGRTGFDSEATYRFRVCKSLVGVGTDHSYGSRSSVGGHGRLLPALSGVWLGQDDTTASIGSPSPGGLRIRVVEPSTWTLGWHPCFLPDTGNRFPDTTIEISLFLSKDLARSSGVSVGKHGVWKRFRRNRRGYVLIDCLQISCL